MESTDTGRKTETEIGRVLETKEGRARVEVSQSSLCAECKAASSCISGSGGTRIVEVIDPLGVSEGQSVRIELGSGRLIEASFLAYIIPLLFLFIGTILGYNAVGSGPSETGGAIGAIAGLGFGLLVSRSVGQYLGRRGDLTPVITAVLDTEPGEEATDADQDDIR